MAKDIEDFLRRAAERRRQQKEKRQPPPPPPPPPRQIARPVEPVIIDDIEIVEERSRLATDMRNQSVPEHVSQHLDTSDIADHAEQLGKRISNVANRVEQQVHQHLDHDISKIDDRPTVTDDPPPAIFGAKQNPLTAELRSLLQNPKTVGRSIFLAEILKRPEWD